LAKADTHVLNARRSIFPREIPSKGRLPLAGGGPGELAAREFYQSGVLSSHFAGAI